MNVIFETIFPTLIIGDSLKSHDGCMFSTINVDNDKYEAASYVSLNKAPWWYCYYDNAILTGHYGEVYDISAGDGILWVNPWDNKKYAKIALMMIRPTN